MDKRQALTILIQNSVTLYDAQKKQLISKIPDLNDAVVETLGQYFKAEIDLVVNNKETFLDMAETILNYLLKTDPATIKSAFS